MNKGTSKIRNTPFSGANNIQESQKRVGTSSRRDQADSERPPCHRAVHGSYRSKVRYRIFPYHRMIAHTMSIAPALYSLQQALTTSSESYLPSIERN
jgi:hypothetical protein